MGFADTASAGRRSRPREEGQDGTGAAALIALVEVIGRRIIEVDRLLDKAQAEAVRIKIEIFQGIAGDCRHMMNA
jgi:hypothetical protein